MWAARYDDAVKIVRVDCHVLLDPDYRIGSTSSAQDDLLVEIHTDEGISGIGETDVNPWIARACIQAPGTHTMGQSLTDLLMGEDPLRVEELWDKLYIGSAMNGRRGAVIHALGALDIALHDLRGKALGKPCYELLGGPALHDNITPYASLQPEVSSFEAYVESLTAWALEAKRRGFRAAKLEITPAGPYAHMGFHESLDRMAEVIAAVRRAVGDEFVLMVDSQYAFPDAETCLAAIRGWTQFNLYFLETPLPCDDIAGYARLAQSQPIPIASGEWLATRWEFLEYMDRGRINVVQPDIGRVGGLTEAMRVVRLARERGLTVVPHLWKTSLSIAAAAHLAAVTPECAYIEYLPADLSESALRKELASDVPLVDGRIPLPRGPGLGVEINRDALEKFRRAAAQVAAW